MDSRPRARERRLPRLAFHASRIVIDIGVLLVMGSMSLPFVIADSGDRSAITADALPALLLVIPIFLVTLIPDHSRPLPAALGWLSLVLAVAALPYSVVKYLDASTVAETVGGEVGTGARLLVFGALVTVAGIVVGLARSILRLPTGGTYPARRVPRPKAAPEEADPLAAAARSGRVMPPRPAAEPPRVRDEPSRTGREATEPAAAPPRRVPPTSDPWPGQGGPQRTAPASGAVAPPQSGRPRPQPRPAPSTRPPERSEPPSADSTPAGPDPGTLGAPRPPDPTSRRVLPPRARRPVISPLPNHQALPRPEHPTEELPGPGAGGEAGGTPDSEQSGDR